MQKIISCIVLFLFVSFSLSAKETKARKLKAAKCGTVVLSDIDDKYSAIVYNKSMPDPDEGPENERLEAAKRKVHKRYPYKRVAQTASKTTAVDTPRIGINFIADSSSGIPPDNYMAISNNNMAISVINQTISIHYAANKLYLNRKQLKSFSLVVGLNNAFNDYRYDPKVIYDPEADKFVCVMLNGTEVYNYIVIGFSKTNDPTGAWNFYKFYGDHKNDTTWFDYPSISITKNHFFLTGNKIINGNSWQAGFKETVVYQLDKMQGYAGDTSLDYQIIDGISYNSRNLRCLHPVKAADTLSSGTQYFLSDRNFDIRNDTFFLVKLDANLGGANSIQVTPLVSNVKYGVPPNGRQPDTMYKLATNDGRVLGAFLKNNQIQFVSTSIDTSSGSSAVYHGIINSVDNNPALSGNILGIDTLDFGYPNISYTGTWGGKVQSIISFNYTGPKTFPGMAATFFDGNAYSNIISLKRGDSSIIQLAGEDQRWGDYTGSQVKWNNLGEVWVEGIYGRSRARYGSYMVQLFSPYYGVPDTTNVDTTITPTIYPNPAWQFVNFEFSLTADEEVEFVIYDVAGRLIDKLPTQYCKKGKNELQFNIAPLAAARYMLRVATKSGKKIGVFNFVRL